MHHPPHPGEVLREYSGNTTVTEAATDLGVNRVTLSRVVTGFSGISADMAFRICSGNLSLQLWERVFATAPGSATRQAMERSFPLKRPSLRVDERWLRWKAKAPIDMPCVRWRTERRSFVA
jgi:addiction module HigA family antidote